MCTKGINKSTQLWHQDDIEW